MRLLYLFTSFIFLSSIVAIGQSPESIQTIESSNGVVYKGWLIDDFDGVIRFEDARGDTISFLTDEIKRRSDPSYFIFKKDKFHLKKGPFSIIDSGLGGRADGFTLQFTYAYGTRVTPKFLVGLGTGFNLSGDFDLLVSQEFFGELFIYGKYYLNNRRIRPFIETKVGAIAGIDKRIREDLYPGILLQGGLGIEFAQYTQTRFSVKGNYLFMYALAKMISPSNVLDDLNLKRQLLGISFNF